ncbi:GTP 3',8-cyclase MoaA [Neisseria chenwenguii]|uniref:GTP 3',8-cyclase MoaA n=1 Tax=Neisseria chenwenguii TaxID=1853278 RepID=UPI000F4D8A04|nr:GTP 3',8-cyclase MoaA [Neisseria chenwenguii]ROV56708.1 GTP 3',8-cyclase MoaA [Neisseria chenwenguii]
MLTDPFGRTVDYLRISVTDRCDLRCTYCLPKGFKGFAIPKDWLTIEELARVAASFARLGTKRFRLTGGEPLLRKGLADLVAEIARQPGVEDISLTTNGTQLEKHARALRVAGVGRLNISLDSLRRDCVTSITGNDCLPQVLDGIKAAKEAGFERIKINMVPLKGLNDMDLDDMVAFCIEHGFILNLIEAMPMGATGQAHAKVNLQPVLAELQQKFDLSPFEGKIGGGPARYWHSSNSGFTLGLITPMSQHFCATCNRVRLSATGNIHLCLGQEDKAPLRDLMRSGCSDAKLDQAVRDAIARKPEKHEFVENPKKIIRVMALTGG